MFAGRYPTDDAVDKDMLGVAFGFIIDCCRTFTTSRGVTVNAVTVEPTVADTILAHDELSLSLDWHASLGAVAIAVIVG